MARRVRLDELEREYPDPPAALLAPAVETYMTAAEIAAHTFTRDGCSACADVVATPPFVGCYSHLEYHAMRRWQDERTSWLRRHRVPRDKWGAVWPSRRPTWNDRPREETA